MRSVVSNTHSSNRVSTRHLFRYFVRKEKLRARALYLGVPFSQCSIECFPEFFKIINNDTYQISKASKIIRYFITCIYLMAGVILYICGTPRALPLRHRVEDGSFKYYCIFLNRITLLLISTSLYSLDSKGNDNNS